MSESVDGWEVDVLVGPGVIEMEISNNQDFFLDAFSGKH